MNQNPITPPSPGLSLGDIYYVLFRHKWKILIISALGIGVAAALPLLKPASYQSVAKVMIRYVVEEKSPATINGTDSRVKSPDDRGGSIINSEIAIITSRDLAQQVADAIGPEKILAKSEGGDDRILAAALIQRNLSVGASQNSSIIEISFKHRDPAIVQPVLNALMESYFKRHAEIHRPVADDFLNRETDRLRSQQSQTEMALRAAKTNAGIISLDGAMKSYSEQMSRIQQDVFSAEAELAQRQATLAEVARLTASQPAAQTNAAPSTNLAVIPPEKMTEYKRTASLLETLVKRDQELSLQFTAENARVKNVREQIAATEKAKADLEKQYPGLLGIVTDSRIATASSGTQMDIIAERANLAAIAAKIQILTNQLAMVRAKATSLNADESSITELERKKELEETQYKYFSASREQSRIDEALGSDNFSNISKVQEPSPPFRDVEKLNKMRLGAAFGGIGFALALAFFIELYLDRSLRRSSQIGSQLRAPLFISIPRLSLNGASRSKKKAKLLPAASGNGNGTTESNGAPSAESIAADQIASSNGHLAVPVIRQNARPFYETLRDRLIMFFEANNLTHKPKLVAITSCEIGAGVTTAAAGLAASLSETGEGNVLLVDMSGHEPEAHHFYKGRLDCGLEDALEGAKRGDAKVQENLYVVSESTTNDKLPQVLPKRFKNLIPKLRASDFDYIIFDMPPVSQISPTPRLAKFMDMVFLVVESEKTNRDVAKHAASLLAESKANVGIVLNKTRNYVPKRLREDL